MQKYNATSELHLIPLEQQRTYCVGTPGEAGLPADDRFARYANTSYNLKCVRAHALYLHLYFPPPSSLSLPLAQTTFVAVMDRFSCS